MAIPPIIPPDIQKDLDQIQADEAARAKARDKQAADHKSLMEVVLPHLDSIHDAEKAMAYIAYVFQTLGDNGCILGVMEDGIGTLGTNLSISGDLNLVQSDYQTYMNQMLQEQYVPGDQGKPYDPNANPPTYGPDTQGVKVFTAVLDTLINIFAADAKSTFSGGPSLLGIDPSEVSNIMNNLCSIRKQIHITWPDGSKDTTPDPSSDPNPANWKTFDSETASTGVDKNGNLTWPDGVYIATDSSAKGAVNTLIQGFNELNYNAQQQGDTTHASDVLKNTNNDNNTTKTSLGSVSQVVNSNLSHATNVEKEAMGFFDNLAHAFFKAMDAAVSNQRSQ